MKVAITGVSGFIGSQLAQHLLARGFEVLGVSRTRFDLNGNYEWLDIEGVHSLSLEGVDVVIHLAALAHSKNISEPKLEEVNVNLTVKLAQAAKSAGVSKFLFLSSIGVNGEHTEAGSYTAESIPKPHNEYSRSKFEAEQKLYEMHSDHTFKVSVIRAPLVLGSGAPGSVRLLQRLASTLRVNPFVAIRNRRSIIRTESLNEILASFCGMSQPPKLLLATEYQPLSTSDILRGLGKELDVNLVPLPIPKFIYYLALVPLGKGKLYTQLCGDLIIEPSDSGLILNPESSALQKKEKE